MAITIKGPLPSGTPGGMGAIPDGNIEKIASGMFGGGPTGIAPAVMLNPGERFTWDDSGRYAGIEGSSDPGMKYIDNGGTLAPSLGPGGMGAITNPGVLFPAIANGWGNAPAGTQGTGGKGVGNIVPAQPQTTGQNFFPQPTIYQSPVTIDSAQSLIQLANTPQGPYRYGDLGLTTSDYSLWGSKGNPYMTGGLGYNPGNRWGTPLVPKDVVPTPPSSGGDSGFPVTTAPGDNGGFWGEDSQGWGDLTYGDKATLGLFAPGLPLLSSLAYGRLDSPYGDYARLPWYEGSAGGGYGYTEEGYDQYAPGDTDRGIYDASTGERAWGDEFDDYNTGDLWAETSWFEGVGNLLGGRTWDGLEAETYGDPNSKLAKQSDAAIAQAEALKQAEKQAVAQAKLDEISKYTGMLQGEFDAQMAAQEDLNSEQIELMTQIKGDMQRDFGDFTTQNSQQMALMAAENASMFDSIEEYRAWQLDTDAQQQSWLDNKFKDQAAQQNDLNATQTDLMNQIAQDMQSTYGSFEGRMGEQLANMAAENASMFDSFAEYKQWMGDSFTTLESGLNEQLAQQAAINEGLNSTQIELMNSIAEDMRSDYGDFASGVDGQLEQMAAENASMFDSFEEYQEWNASNVDNAQPGTPPSGGSSDEAGSASDSNMADAGFSQEDQDFIDSGFDDSGSGGDGSFGDGTGFDGDAESDMNDADFGVDSDWGDWGDDDGGFE